MPAGAAILRIAATPVERAYRPVHDPDRTVGGPGTDRHLRPVRGHARVAGGLTLSHVLYSARVFLTPGAVPGGPGGVVSPHLLGSIDLRIVPQTLQVDFLIHAQTSVS